MNAQALMMDSRLIHVRELKAENAALRAELASLRDEKAAWEAHFDFALAAAEDLRAADLGKLVLVDGWNLILGARKEARDRDDLLSRMRRYLAEHPQDRVWVVFDGPHPSTSVDGRLRVTYTGGTGPHRADRFVAHFVRMASYLGLAEKLEVRTNDKDFRREVGRFLSGPHRP